MHWQTDAITEGAAKLAETIRTHRRNIHRRPELAFDEHATAAYVESVLDDLGVPHRRVVETGVVAVVRGRGPGCVGVRADMDALPVPEAPGRDGYRSEVEGLSHACGHDAHVAVALGLVELLTGVEDLPGTVAFYFQPAEEGPGGAAPMVEAGVLDDPAPSAVLGLHVSSRHHSGVVAVRSGPSTASDDAFDITVEGVGGHAAHPEEAVDPVPVAAEIVSAVQQLVTREINPVTPVVFTFGSIHGGTRRNVIATSVALSGTLRTVHRANRERLIARIPQMCKLIAEAHRATVRVHHQAGYDVGVNDPALTDLVAGAARAVAGEQQVVVEQYPTLGGEDFYAFGATGLPVTMFLLGVANPERGIIAPNHSPGFDLDEDALPIGVAVFAETIRRLLVGHHDT
jgi:amidohydrolase